VLEDVPQPLGELRRLVGGVRALRDDAVDDAGAEQVQ
jgi:hypothetical protein